MEEEDGMNDWFDHNDCPNYDSAQLNKYIGRTYDADLKAQIEKEFEPYKLMLCDEDEFYLEDFWVKQIRCVVEDDGKIKRMQFN